MQKRSADGRVGEHGKLGIVAGGQRVFDRLLPLRRNDVETVRLLKYSRIYCDTEVTQPAAGTHIVRLQGSEGEIDLRAGENEGAAWGSGGCKT